MFRVISARILVAGLSSGAFPMPWNSGWWFDCAESAQHYDLSRRTGTGPLPWEWLGERLSGLLERWRQSKEQTGCRIM